MPGGIFFSRRVIMDWLAIASGLLLAAMAVLWLVACFRMGRDLRRMQRLDAVASRRRERAVR